MHSSIAHFFACDSSCPSFNVFLSNPFSYLTHTIAGENEAKNLNFHRLKVHTDTEWNVFKKNLRKEAKHHCIEAEDNIFFQFVHDGDVLLNNHKHQAFGMQFADGRFRCNNFVALSFRKSLSGESNTTLVLAK